MTGVLISCEYIILTIFQMTIIYLLTFKLGKKYFVKKKKHHYTAKKNKKCIQLRLSQKLLLLSCKLQPVLLAKQIFFNVDRYTQGALTCCHHLKHVPSGFTPLWTTNVIWMVALV